MSRTAPLRPVPLSPLSLRAGAAGTVSSRPGISAAVVEAVLSATRAAAIAAAPWRGRGDGPGADGAATDAMRRALAAAPGTGTVVSGEGAKDDAPMLADGERVGRGGAPRYELAIDPLECTDLCAQGLPGALATIAVAPEGALWSPGPAFYMDKLVAGRRARAAIDLDAELEVNLEGVAQALRCDVADLRVVVLDKPRHRRLVAGLRDAGVRVRTPSAGDVAASLEVLLDDGDADLLLGIGGTPEGLLTACAARALGGAMQGRLAPQRDEERAALSDLGVDVGRRLELDDLVRADAVFVATGISGGLLRAIEQSCGTVTTESLIVAPGEVRRVVQRTCTDRQE